MNLKIMSLKMGKSSSKNWHRTRIPLSPLVDLSLFTETSSEAVLEIKLMELWMQKVASDFNQPFGMHLMSNSFVFEHDNDPKHPANYR